MIKENSELNVASCTSVSAADNEPATAMNASRNMIALVLLFHRTLKY